MIQISKMDTGHIDLHRQRVDLAALIKDVTGLLAPLALEKNLQVTMRSEPATLEMPLDRDKMLAVLAEIMQQMMDRSAPGTLEISNRVEGNAVQCALSAPLRADAEKNVSEFRLTTSRAILQAHGGRLLIKESAGRCVVSLSVPILSADDFFYERTRGLYEGAVAKSLPMTVVRIYLPQWALMRKMAGEEKASAFWKQLQVLVSQALRSESDFALQSRQNIWLALPGARRGDGQAIVDRIEHHLRESAMPEVPQPVEMGSQVASYPESAQTVESLLLLIGWFTEGRIVSPAAAVAKKIRPAA
jgi:hypothetical protein